MNPRVSILWVNYNSLSFIKLALESLKAIRDLDYSDYELIMVDNGSFDGSFIILKNYLEKGNINCKVIRLERNLGFTGGNNVAYSARSRESKHVVLLNNDAVPRQESLAELVDIMENDVTLGAAQGVILNFDDQSIDTAGDYLSELLEATSLLQGNDLPSLRKPVYSTSADAAYSIFRVKAINSISSLNGNLLDDYLFGYLDDHMLGLRLWNNAFKVKVFPIITAKHKRGSSFSKSLPLQAYLSIRNLMILNEISNSRYKNLIRLFSLRQLSTLFLLRVLGSTTNQCPRELSAIISKAFADGVRIGRAKYRLGERIDLYKAPILKVQISTAFLKTAVSLRFAGLHLRKELDKIAI
jgi:GT2 family glycosyltransferase